MEDSLWKIWRDIACFSGLFCYHKTVARTQSLIEFQKPLLWVFSNIYISNSPEILLIIQNINICSRLLFSWFLLLLGALSAIASSALNSFGKLEISLINNYSSIMAVSKANFIPVDRYWRPKKLSPKREKWKCWN